VSAPKSWGGSELPPQTPPSFFWLLGAGGSRTLRPHTAASVRVGRAAIPGIRIRCEKRLEGLVFGTGGSRALHVRQAVSFEAERVTIGACSNRALHTPSGVTFRADQATCPIKPKNRTLHPRTADSSRADFVTFPMSQKKGGGVWGGGSPPPQCPTLP